MDMLISNSPEATVRLGEEWGRTVPSGTVIGLSGDLGAGKTQLVRGIARGLGSAARVHSPTFALLNEYTDGRLRLYHLDLYRLGGPDDICAAGLAEFLGAPPGVAVVEWYDRWEAGGGQVPARLRRVWIEIRTEHERLIRHADTGA